MTSAVFGGCTLFWMFEAGVMPSEESNPTARIALRPQLFLLDESLDALVELLDLSLEEFRHDFVKFLRDARLTNLFTGKLLLTR